LLDSLLQETVKMWESQPLVGVVGTEDLVYSHLKHYLDNPKFSDVSIVVEGQRVLCHRILLQPSKYFQRVLDEWSDESTRPIFVLDNIPLADVQRLLHYFYSGQIRVTVKNVKQMLKAAQYLEVESLELKLESLLASKDYILASATKRNLDRAHTKKPVSVLKKRVNEENSALSTQERESDECKQTEHDEETLQVIENTYVIEEHSSQIIEPTGESQAEGNIDPLASESSCSQPTESPVHDLDERRIYQFNNGPQYRKKQSKVWDYFGKTLDGDSVVCLRCGIQLRYTSNTTLMARHIKRFHQSENSSHNPPSPSKLRRKMVPRSAIWRYFIRRDDVDDDPDQQLDHTSREPTSPGRVECRLCQSVYVFSHNTSNLRLHLKLHHSEAFSNINNASHSPHS